MYGFVGRGRRRSVPEHAERRVDVGRAANRVAREPDGRDNEYHSAHGAYLKP